MINEAAGAVEASAGPMPPGVIPSEAARNIYVQYIDGQVAQQNPGSTGMDGQAISPNAQILNFPDKVEPSPDQAVPEDVPAEPLAPEPEPAASIENNPAPDAAKPKEGDQAATPMIEGPTLPAPEKSSKTELEAEAAFGTLIDQSREKDVSKKRSNEEIAAGLNELAVTVETEDFHNQPSVDPVTKEVIPGEVTQSHRAVLTQSDGKRTERLINASLAESIRALDKSPDASAPVLPEDVPAEPLAPEPEPVVSSEAAPEPITPSETDPEPLPTGASAEAKTDTSEPKISAEMLAVDPRSIDDIVKIDESGHGHKSGIEDSEGNRYKNGQFLTNHETNLIVANQDLIRDGMEHRGGPDVIEPPREPGNPEPGRPEIPPEITNNAPEIVANEEAIVAYDSAVEALGHAQRRLERMFGGKDAKELFHIAGENVEKAGAELIRANAAMVKAQNEKIDALYEANHVEAEEDYVRLKELMHQKTDEQIKGSYDGRLDEEIEELVTSVVDHAAYTDIIDGKIEKRQAEVAINNAQLAIELPDKVDKALIAERTKAHPRLTRVNEWAKNHPKTRIAIGLGLAAMGVVGAATFNAPLVAVAMTGGAVLRGYGSYNFARGIGEMVASHRAKKTDIKTIEDYLTVAERQSSARRNSKRAGAVVAAVLVAAPLVGKMLDLFHHGAEASTPRPKGVAPRTTPPAGTGTNPIAPPEALNITPIDGNELPWDFLHNSFGLNMSDPAVLHELVYNKLGIVINGNGLGGGLGAVKSVFIPGQGTFTDLAHINGALQAIIESNN
jgi:hemerythrin superfamily protein